MLLMQRCEAVLSDVMIWDSIHSVNDKILSDDILKDETVTDEKFNVPFSRVKVNT